MVKALVVDPDTYDELTSQYNTADSAIYISKRNDGFWLAARSNKETVNWETFGTSHSYYWIDEMLTPSLGDFLEKMIDRYSEDAIFLLFHQELFEGFYEECGEA